MKKLILILICVLYVFFQGIDMWFPAHRSLSSCSKFTAILLCFCLMLVPLESDVCRRDQALVRTALTITLLSDFLLLFTPHHALAVFVFCGAHLIYIKRYRKTFFIGSVIFYSIFVLFAIMAKMLWPDLPYELLAGGCYAVLILTAYGCSLTAKLPPKQKCLAVVGMTLFVLCDINVLLFNLFPMSGYHRVSGLFMWFFYLPSQLCISLSASCREKGPRQTDAYRSQQPF